MHRSAGQHPRVVVAALPGVGSAIEAEANVGFAIESADAHDQIEGEGLAGSEADGAQGDGGLGPVAAAARISLDACDRSGQREEGGVDDGGLVHRDEESLMDG